MFGHHGQFNILWQQSRCKCYETYNVGISKLGIPEEVIVELNIYETTNPHCNKLVDSQESAI